MEYNKSVSDVETKKQLQNLIKDSKPCLFTRILPDGRSEFKMYEENEWKEIIYISESPKQL